MKRFLVPLIFILSSSQALAYPIHWNASKQALNTTLIKVVENVSEVTPVIVNSTLRSKKHNRRVGGAHRSYHLTGNAVDFRIRPVAVKQVTAHLLTDPRVGGIKHYGGGKFHIDTGRRRSWGGNVPVVNKRKRSKRLERIAQEKTVYVYTAKSVKMNIPKLSGILQKVKEKHDTTP